MKENRQVIPSLKWPAIFACQGPATEAGLRQSLWEMQEIFAVDLIESGALANSGNLTVYRNGGERAQLKIFNLFAVLSESPCP